MATLPNAAGGSVPQHARGTLGHFRWTICALLARIGRLEYRGNLVRPLADAVHVVVRDEGNA